MKKNKKMTTITASLAMLAVTTMSLGAGTLAWFTRGTEATASGFNFTASAATGMLISTDAENWQSNITSDDLSAIGDNTVTVDGMEPVSTINDVNVNGGLDFYTATYASDSYNLTSDTENYLEFDLYFRNDGADALTLKLSDVSSITDGDTNKDTSLSTRVAFINQGSSSDPAVATGLTGGSSAYIWEPNSTVRSASASNAGATESAKYTYNGLDDSAAGQTATPANINAYGNIDNSAGYTSLVDSTNDLAVGDSDAITTLPASSDISKIKVFVWLEGQDVDNANDVSAGDVNIDFTFDSASTTGTSESVVEDRTATAINTTGGVSTVTIDGTGELGVEYEVYVYATANDSISGLDYDELLAKGVNTGTTTEIALDNELAAGDYAVVVTGEYVGSVSARTEVLTVTNTAV